MTQPNANNTGDPAHSIPCYVTRLRVGALVRSSFPKAVRSQGPNKCHAHSQGQSNVMPSACMGIRHAGVRHPERHRNSSKGQTPKDLFEKTRAAVPQKVALRFQVCLG
jgi:hypothetical protein